jgi:DNA-binding CsgD family transcriptional regulator
VGHASRIAGLVTGGDAGLALLQDAVRILEHSPACLEYAKALKDFGAALRRDNQRIRAREPLEAAISLASLCGAAPIVQLAETELRAAGVRPRRAVSTGVDALTVSERRVAEMAAIPGTTNRDIAQALFVTTKTVEIHLSATYRKLDITKRSELAGVLHP